jgi:hypothetical protein
VEYEETKQHGSFAEITEQFADNYIIGSSSEASPDVIKHLDRISEVDEESPQSFLCSGFGAHAKFASHEEDVDAPDNED